MEKLVVLTSYPPKGTIHNDQVVGVATYTKLLLTDIAKKLPEAEITVFAEQFTSPETYTEDGITIERVWKRNNIFSLPRLFFTLLFRPERTLLVSFEFAMFGNPVVTLLALKKLLFLKLIGKRIITIMHQAPSSLAELAPNPLIAAMLNIGKSVLYKLISAASTQIIVFETQLKDNLGGNDTISVIPHFVPIPEERNKIEARRQLHLPNERFVVLYFGFLAPYKGVDRLIDMWQESQDYMLILAGGTNPNHKNIKRLKAFINTVKRHAEAKGIVPTDFVPEEKIPLYFSACDAVILPYSAFISSSGPLSLAFAYEKPVILSETLSVYEKTPDIAEGLTQAQITMQDLTYTDAESLAERLVWMKRYRAKGAVFSHIMKRKRPIDHIAEEYINLLFERDLNSKH